jgi:hypothetical protein
MDPAMVTGTVRGPDGLPLPGATVSALGTPLDPAVADGDGHYNLALPSGTDAGYELLALAPDLAYVLTEIGLQGPRTVDFDLPTIRADGFESGGFATLPWQRSGAVLWTVDGAEAHEGVMSARSGAIAHGASTELAIDHYVNGGGEFSFWYRTDSEVSYDKLRFYLDGQLEGTWSGNVAWTRWSADLPAGQHSFRWVYSKDSSVSVGADAAWIDLVTFPGTGVEPLAALTIDSPALETTVPAGTTGGLTLGLGNAGDARIEFTATAAGAADGDPAPAWLTVTPDTGQVYPGSLRMLDVVCDGRRASAGVHEARIVIASNDPDHPDTSVSVTLTVTAVSDVADGLPRHPVLHGAVPNPFNPSTDLRFTLPHEARVDLRVYDVSGRLVRVLADGQLPAGEHAVHWNGRDDGGRAAASGVYYVRLAADGETGIKPITLVR